MLATAAFCIFLTIFLAAASAAAADFWPCRLIRRRRFPPFSRQPVAIAFILPPIFASRCR